MLNFFHYQLPTHHSILPMYNTYMEPVKKSTSPAASSNLPLSASPAAPSTSPFPGGSTNFPTNSSDISQLPTSHYPLPPTPGPLPPANSRNLTIKSPEAGKSPYFTSRRPSYKLSLDVIPILINLYVSKCYRLTARSLNLPPNTVHAAVIQAEKYYNRKLFSLKYLRVPKSPTSSLVRTKVHDPYKQITELVPTKFARRILPMLLKIQIGRASCRERV